MNSHHRIKMVPSSLLLSSRANSPQVNNRSRQASNQCRSPTASRSRKSRLLSSRTTVKSTSQISSNWKNRKRSWTTTSCPVCQSSRFNRQIRRSTLTLMKPPYLLKISSSKGRTETKWWIRLGSCYVARRLLRTCAARLSTSLRGTCMMIWVQLMKKRHLFSRASTKIRNLFDLAQTSN